MGNDAAAILGFSFLQPLGEKPSFYLEIIFYSKGEIGELLKDLQTAKFRIK